MSCSSTCQRDGERQKAQTNGHGSSFQAKTRPGEWVVRRREWKGNGKCASKRQKSRSRPGGREDEIEWVRHIAGAATLGRSSGFGRSYASGLPVRNSRLENLHYND